MKKNEFSSIISDAFNDEAPESSYDDMIQVSASKMNQYSDCSMKYYFKYVLNLEPTYLGDAVIFGGAIHKGIERYNLHLAMKDEFPKISDIVDEFRSNWATLCATGNMRFVTSIKRGVPHDKNSLATMGQSLLERFDMYRRRSRYKPFIDNRGKPTIEYGFFFPIEVEGADNVFLYGYIDVIERDGKGNTRIVDYKTGSRAYADFKKLIDLQPMVYQYAYTYKKKHKELPVPKGKEQVGYILLHKKKIELKPYMRQISDVTNAQIQKIVQGFINGISNEVFMPVSYKNELCGYCDYKDSCAAWLKGNDPTLVPNMRVKQYKKK